MANLLCAPAAFANVVGTVIFKTGDVLITHEDKSSVAATKDLALNAGDTIETREGRVQFSLIDGGKISLQPNSVFKIDKYEFSGKQDGSEYAFMELIKGGLRTITGLIGHKNRERYQLKTAVATIGIRGTEFTVNFNNNLMLMTTNYGSVDVCGTSGSCLNATTGKSIAVNGIGASPEYSDKPAEAASAPPSSNKPTFAVADAINNSGLPLVVANAAPSLANYNGAGIASVVVHSSCGCDLEAVLNANFITDSSARVTSISNNDNANPIDLSLNNSFISSSFSDGLISIGRVWDTANSNAGQWVNSSATNNITWMDYIVGEKPNPGPLNNLSGTYNVFASTAPMLLSNSGASQVGSANTMTGSFVFNFSNGGSYSYNLNVPTSSDTYSLAGSATSLNANDPRFASAGTINSVGSACSGGSCSPGLINGNLVQGAFFGKNGERVGLQFEFFTPSGSIYGSAALKAIGSTTNSVSF